MYVTKVVHGPGRESVGFWSPTRPHAEAYAAVCPYRTRIYGPCQAQLCFLETASGQVEMHTMTTN